jgi:acetylornithine deacetylase/succinyl-diaminopimelate desuccinylase-like protein
MLPFPGDLVSRGGPRIVAVAGTDLRAKISRALENAIADRERQTIELLRSLIRTESVTGCEGSHGQSETVSGLLWDELGREPRVMRAYQTVQPGRDNIIATVSGRPGGVFVLDAHTDTVPLGALDQWFTGNPLAAIDGVVEYLGNNQVRLSVEGKSVERTVRPRYGRLWGARGVSSAPVIYGRGSFDNKGPVAVAYLATAALADALERTGCQLNGTLVCGFVVDEEEHMLGTRAFAGGAGSWLDSAGLLPAIKPPESFRKGIIGVALDGSYGFVPVVGHRGISHLLVRTFGQSAHAATPYLGASAVTRMASVLNALDRNSEDVQTELEPLFADDLLEPASLALGTTIVGGGIRSVEETDQGRIVHRTGINVVADWCEATIDCRHPRPADRNLQTIGRRIEQIVEGQACKQSGLNSSQVSVSLLGGGPPCATAESPEAATNDPLIAAIISHGQKISGFTPWIETAPGGTDATIMIHQGRIKTLVEFGPAGAFAHEPHEFVERDQIAIGARILAETIIDLLGFIPA